MIDNHSRYSPRTQLAILIISTILILLIGRYYKTVFIYRGFYFLNLLLPILGSLFLNALFLKIPLSELGYARPHASKRLLITTFSIAVFLPFLMYLLRYHPQYFEYYGIFRNFTLTPIDRIQRFGLFIVSTLLGWELLLRAYLLFGIKHLLSKLYKGSEQFNAAVAILWVCSFEAIYHVLKPDVEAFGMLIASPALSYLALKTKSVLPALLCHFYIEALFVVFVIFA